MMDDAYPIRQVSAATHARQLQVMKNVLAVLVPYVTDTFARLC